MLKPSISNESSISLTIPDAVDASGLSRSAIYLALASGALRARKNGRRTLIEAAELRRFIDSLPLYQPVPPPIGKRPRGRPRKQLRGGGDDPARAA